MSGPDPEFAKLTADWMAKHRRPKRNPEQRRARYDELRDQYAKLYGELELIKIELNMLEKEMLERGEIEEGDIA